MGILKTQDHFLSSRVVPTVLQHKSLLPHSIMFSECNESWKALRNLCRAEMFSTNALQAYFRLREEKMDRLLEFLSKKQGEVINTGDIVFTTLFNTLSCIVFDKDVLDLEEEHETFVGVKRKGGLKHVHEAFDYWKDMIEERRAHINSSTWSSVQSKSFLDRLLENGFSNDRINQYVTEKMDRLLEFLSKKQGEVISTGDIVFTTMFNTLSCIVFDKDVLDLEEEHETFVGGEEMFSECNESWKALRNLCRAEMFSTNALQAYSRLREEKMDRLLEFLSKKQGEVINTWDIVFTTLFNTLSCIVFDKDVLDLEEEHENFVGVKRKGGLKHVHEAFDYWKDMIEERRAHINSSTWSSVQSKSFLDRLHENGFSNDRINQYVTELFVAGTNTTTTALIRAMAEIVNNKDVMTKIEEKMKREINLGKIELSQLSKLPYLQACAKESLRLHPPVPFLLPRRAVETCEVMNYTIPKNASIFVNVWAIGRDPNVWDDPLSFKPERFLASNLDFKGQNYEFLPFGSGRRIFPGLPLGSRSMEFIIASLIHEFDWVLPNNEVPSKVDMDDKFLITLRKEKPLKLIFKPKHRSSTV
ncbi:hypothetical protein L1987_62482 [Smallanthus sonchifolius]|uniref:Uncharacterized protein n=1 Tax=Smallanthus sonchifolius TaxID=185202 RepID=A0ACB9CAI6_9ASTR|nr:hypothetical protein L1987_62482 [Smallanthus sonchifolius]